VAGQGLGRTGKMEENSVEVTADNMGDWGYTKKVFLEYHENDIGKAAAKLIDLMYYNHPRQKRKQRVLEYEEMLTNKRATFRYIFRVMRDYITIKELRKKINMSNLKNRRLISFIKSKGYDPETVWQDHPIE